MKHNLSNKPKANFTIKASHEELLDFIVKTVEWDGDFREELRQLKLRIMQKQTQYSRAEVVRIIEGIEGLKELNFESVADFHQCEAEDPTEGENQWLPHREPIEFKIKKEGGDK